MMGRPRPREGWGLKAWICPAEGRAVHVTPKAKALYS